MLYTKENINTFKKVESLLPPSIVNLGDKKWMVFTGESGGWHSIDNTVTLEMVQSRWTKWESKKSGKVDSKIKSIEVKGSKGNMYTVSNINGSLSCSCVGFGFRRRCKHVEQAKTQLGVAA